MHLDKTMKPCFDKRSPSSINWLYTYCMFINIEYYKEAFGEHTMESWWLTAGREWAPRATDVTVSRLHFSGAINVPIDVSEHAR